MRFRAVVTVVSLDAPLADPIVLKEADVEMTYDYVDHNPGNALIVQHLEITPHERGEV